MRTNEDKRGQTRRKEDKIGQQWTKEDKRRQKRTKEDKRGQQRTKKDKGQRRQRRQMRQRRQRRKRRTKEDKEDNSRGARDNSRQLKTTQWQSKLSVISDLPTLSDDLVTTAFRSSQTRHSSLVDVGPFPLLNPLH